jgi:hypothetical protein
VSSKQKTETKQDTATQYGGQTAQEAKQAGSATSLGGTATAGKEHAESTQDRTGVSKGTQEQINKGQTATTGKGGSTGTTTQIGTGATTGSQQGTTTSTGGGETSYQYGDVDRKGSADIDRFREMIQGHTGLDPTIAYQAANAREQVMKLAQNPLGGYTTPESRQAATQAALEQIGSQEGQAFQADAHRRAQEALQMTGMQGQLAQMTQPLRELLGTKQAQTQTGTTDMTSAGTSQQAQTGTSEQQNWQDQMSNTLSSLFGTNTQETQDTIRNISDQLSQQAQASYGESTSEDTSSQTGSQSGYQNQQGSGTQTQSAPMWGSLVGGIGNAATSALI